ncbi:hypothetical protein FACS1894133_1220 [Clostridia bacterium]|nr:hypothetical protein FACS1894133_1220 [Clostridia bacterium]
MAVSVGKVYADAIFGIISEDTAGSGTSERKAKFSECRAELAALADAFSENPAWASALVAPCYPKEERIASFVSVFGGKISVYTENLIKLMLLKSRVKYVNEVYKEFTLSYNALFDIIGVTVTSAYELTSGEVAKIAARVSEKYGGKEVVITEKVDSALIGGAVIDVGTTRLDGSIKANLKSLHSDLVNTKLATIVA